MRMRPAGVQLLSTPASRPRPRAAYRYQTSRVRTVGTRHAVCARRALSWVRTCARAGRACACDRSSQQREAPPLRPRAHRATCARDCAHGRVGDQQRVRTPSLRVGRRWSGSRRERAAVPGEPRQSTRERASKSEPVRTRPARTLGSDTPPARRIPAVQPSPAMRMLSDSRARAARNSAPADTSRGCPPQRAHRTQRQREAHTS